MPDFSSLGLGPHLLSVLEECGYERPTPIQSQSIPLLLKGKDIVGHSKTGSGKTAAYSLPILQALKAEHMAPQALVVCPTRELCTQVVREIRMLGRKIHGLTVLPITGGQPIRAQLDSLEGGVQIAVGTPGRLLDHIKRDSIALEGIRTVVLDEADRMLDMGFQKDVEEILEQLPTNRQTVFYSATFLESIEVMSQIHQKDATKITVESENDGEVITELCVPAEASEKESALHWILSEYSYERALVFCNFKASVKKLKKGLLDFGLSADALHGDLDQFHRDQVLARFRNQSICVLIATDVAGRGIDVEDLDMVINFELPDKPQVYMHRIGRTGRAGKSGLSVSLATKRESKKTDAIEELSGKKLMHLPALSFDERNDWSSRLSKEAPMTTLLVSGGRKDKIRPGDILGALTGESGGLAGTDVGKIEIYDKYSYVAVSKDHAKQATRSINAGRIKKKRFKATLLGSSE